MKIGPKYKICKRLGGGVFEKCQTQKFQLAEARARKGGSGRRRGMSDYGKQLIEKQKVRFSYGITEKQLRKYVDIATASADAVSTMNRELEMRLDNVIYRAGFASTRRMARQIVSHGHITVNGRKLKVPSYTTKVGDKIAVRDGSKSKTVFADVTRSNVSAPKWLNTDMKKLSLEVKAEPVFESGATIFDYPAVFELYSR
jgi:small subunit ribosomal protein S4